MGTDLLVVRNGDILKAWVEFVRRFASEGTNTMMQERKFKGGVQWCIPGGDWEGGLEVTPQQMGYQPRSSKMRQLTRNYFNQEGFDRAREKLLGRIKSGKNQSSVAVPMIARTKREDSMGHCIQSVALTHYRQIKGRGGYLEVDFFYRTTEVLQKFLADLIFLRYHVVPYLTEGIDDPITIVRFHFASIQMSPLFLPVLFNWVDPIEFMEEVKEGDPRFYQRVLFRVEIPLRREAGYYNFRTRRQMHHLYFSLMEQGIIDREAILEYIEREVNR